MYDRKAIQEQFNKVIAHSQFIPNPQTTKLFDKWEENKKFFIERTNGELIWTIPEKVSVELTEKEKESRIADFVTELYTYYGFSWLGEFIEINKDGFYKNKVVVKGCTGADGEEIPLGMRLLKAFKYFIKDPILLEKVQNQASRIIQEDKLEGYLCLSVHPLDYLSSSENTYNWRSCHALNGEYRSGNLSYMGDKHTMVCYIRGEEEVVLPNFPEDIKWNSKKWRMLLFEDVNSETLFAGRQYPFFHKELLDKVLHYFYKGKFRYTDWTNERIYTLSDGTVLNNEYLCFQRDLLPKRSIITDAPYSLQFNDLLRSSQYIPYYIQKNYTFTKPRFVIGSAVPCLLCEEAPVVASDSFYCMECELDYGSSEDERFGYCENCGRRIFLDEAIWSLSGNSYCSCECAQIEEEED